MRRALIGSARVAVDDDQPTFWDRVEAGTWEPGTIGVYEAATGPGTLVLDLGAWVGPLALLAAARGARVVAVEADPAALRQLNRNLAANPDLAERIAVRARAVAAEPGPVRLGARRKPGDSMSSVLLANGPGAWTVDAMTPDDLAAELRPGERLFVKLDIEGGEYDVLPALWPLLHRTAGTLLLSIHPEFLRDAGEGDPGGRGLAALAGAEGWAMARVDASGPTPLVAVRSDLESASTWLVSAPG